MDSDSRGKRAWLKKINLPLVLVTAGVGLLYVLFLPRFLYPADPYTSRAEAAHWVMTGQLGIDYVHREQLGGLVADRGSYFFENDDKGRFFSKYGLGNTLGHVPAMLLEKTRQGEVALLSNSPSLILYIGLVHTLWTMAFVAYLFLLASFYSHKTWVRSTFVLLSLFTTFLGYYLRASAHEIFQITAMAGLCFHGLRFVRGSDATGVARPWKHLFFASLWAGLLAMLKSSYVVLFAPLWFSALLAGEGRLWTRALSNVRRDWGRYTLCLVLPSIAWAGIFLWSNHYRFGSVWETGYMQWMRTPDETYHLFSLEYVPKAMNYFWVKPGNGNAFMHYPVFLLALFAWPFFFRKHKPEAAFLLTLFLLALFTISYSSAYTGLWCFGPRYLVPLLPVMALPFIKVLEWCGRRPITLWRWGCVALMTLLLAVSLYYKTAVNSLHFFAFYNAREFFRPFGMELYGNYFGPLHYGIVCRDLIAFRDRGKPFPPLRAVERRIPPDRDDVKAVLRHRVENIAAPNALFLK